MGRARTPSTDAWEYVVGLLPHRVIAYEDRVRGGRLYLKFRVDGKQSVRSLGMAARLKNGALDKDACKRACAAADQQYDVLVRGLVANEAQRKAAQRAALTIAQGWALATDPDKGKWNKKTPHRAEMRRAIDRAKAAWGANARWNDIGRGELRQLWRRELKAQRAKNNAGVVAAEKTAKHVLTVADWLRNEQLIDDRACLRWPSWKQELFADAGEYEPKRLRYTGEEYLRFLDATAQFDARWDLLVHLGAELRLGQVKRVMRSWVKRETVKLESGPVERVRILIKGAGKKGGTLLTLTPGQVRRLDQALTSGYLAGLERAFQAGEIADYPLFPGRHLPVVDGQLVTAARHATRDPLDDSALRTWFRETEQRAQPKIPHVPGRGWYAMRRAGVDLAKSLGISREGLQASGGWTTAQIPDTIYADQKMEYSSEEAMNVRVKMRGEHEPNEPAAIAPTVPIVDKTRQAPADAEACSNDSQS